MERLKIRSPRRRNSLRYSGYDYRQAGCYFVTICTHARQLLFGTVVDGQIELSPAGSMAERCWFETGTSIPGVHLDSFIVMPDHLHAILMLGTDPSVPLSMSLPTIVRRFKNQVQARYRHQVANGTLPPYAGRLWQRRYNDRIIRSDRELEAIREYIFDNPRRWQEKRNAFAADGSGHLP